MTRREWITAAVVLALLAAIPFVLNWYSAYSAKSEVMSVLKAQMRDPDSTEVRNVRRLPSGAFCGEVNGRNGFGGYVGFKRFYVSGNLVTIEGEGELEGFVAGMCAR